MPDINGLPPWVYLPALLCIAGILVTVLAALWHGRSIGRDD
jgi:hypothetical protein